jgi:YHS domain-containing protein
MRLIMMPSGGCEKSLSDFRDSGVLSMSLGQFNIMKIAKNLTAIALSVSVLAAPLAGLAEDKPVKPPKPDKLTTCPVSGDKLGEMGKPVVIVYKDQEVKFCCKDCKKDFDKDPAKYMKKIRAADKDAPAKDPKN